MQLGCQSLGILRLDVTFTAIDLSIKVLQWKSLNIPPIGKVSNGGCTNRHTRLKIK